MKSQHAIVAALSGKHRYMVLEALHKRVENLEHRIKNNPDRKDLERIRAEMAELHDMLADDVKVHENNAERLGQPTALLLAWPSNS